MAAKALWNDKEHRITLAYPTPRHERDAFIIQSSRRRKYTRGTDKFEGNAVDLSERSDKFRTIQKKNETSKHVYANHGGKKYLPQPWLAMRRESKSIPTSSVRRHLVLRSTHVLTPNKHANEAPSHFISIYLVLLICFFDVSSAHARKSAHGSTD